MGREFALQIPELVEIDEIWLLARRKKKLDELAAVLEARRKAGSAEKKAPHARAIEIDVSGRAGVMRFATVLECERVLDEKFGGFEIVMLVNNAGFGTYGTFEETDIQREMDMIDLNCTALVGICGYALSYMQYGATIINTASLAAFLPLGNFAVYAATKSFVLSFSVALAAELSGRGITVCALCPGPVSTEFAAVASNGARKNVLHGLSAEKVVRHGLRRALRGKPVAIMAVKWKCKAFASRFVGRFFGALFTFRHCKRPCRH